ncbi:ANTAR domain-containing protein, partial [Streptomyces flavofungini]|uniref:ANTAR domain-containing protein n=1 Tax=Streptomyces flavofungini TaxID=68200 RepID=UPI0034E03DEE
MPEPAHPEQPLTGDDGGAGHAGHPPLPGTPLPATIDTVPDGTRVGVIVRNELDLDACQRIRPDLLRALSRSVDGLDLYMSEVTFCDCSGINLLLALRRRALRHGRTVTLRTSSPAVDRILDLTATHGLFEPVDFAFDFDEEPEAAPVDATNADGQSPQDLRTVVAQLRRALQTRPTIDLARGILMSVFSLSPEAAWEVLVTASQNTNTKLHRLAGDVVDTVKGEDLPAAVRKQLVNAVAKTNKAHPAPRT